LLCRVFRIRQAAELLITITLRAARHAPPPASTAHWALLLLLRVPVATATTLGRRSIQIPAQTRFLPGGRRPSTIVLRCTTQLHLVLQVLVWTSFPPWEGKMAVLLVPASTRRVSWKAPASLLPAPRLSSTPPLVSSLYPVHPPTVLILHPYRRTTVLSEPGAHLALDRLRRRLWLGPRQRRPV
jgi:hypothetical protein